MFCQDNQAQVFCPGQPSSGIMLSDAFFWGMEKACVSIFFFSAWRRLTCPSIIANRGHQHASGVRLIAVPPIQACCQHACCLACVELCPLGREGFMIGGQVVPTQAIAKQLPLS